MNGINIPNQEDPMDGETSKDKLVGDLKTLIGDAEELLKATTSQAGEKVTAARQRIEQSLIEGKKSTTHQLLKDLNM
jgi:ElaB/YqjD/DUF883 family membrane-anchored ribosome-binding protein